MITLIEVTALFFSTIAIVLSIKSLITSDRQEKEVIQKPKDEEVIFDISRKR